MTSASPTEGIYSYRHVSPAVLFSDMAFRDGSAGPGDPLPAFDLPEADGGRLRSADLIGKRPVLLVTGSLTCPMTASSNPKLRRLHHRFQTEIEFVTLHVREAHPGEERDQPDSHDAKVANAREMKRRDRLAWKVAVDGPEGSIHRAFDEKPNAAYLTDRTGRIVFRALWAADDEGLREAMLAVLRGERPAQRESTRRIGPMADGIAEMYELLRRSGGRAERDLWRSAPPMAAMAWLADLYRPLPPRWRVAAAAASAGLGIAVAARLLVGALAGRR